jgi:membrane protein
VISIVITSLMFGLIFKYVPAIKIAWRDVWVGALVTGVLFTIGKELIGLYLGRSAVASAYGVAGSLAIVLLWVYYVSQVFFLGAEFTKAYATSVGAGVEPDESAVSVKADTREAYEKSTGGEEKLRNYPSRQGSATTVRGDGERLRREGQPEREFRSDKKREP